MLNAEPDSRPDRRSNTRYPVRGSVVLDTDRKRYSGIPVDLSLGGTLFHADPVPPLGSVGTLQLNVEGYGETIVARVRVIRVQGTCAAAIFILPQPTLVRCIAWLARKDRAEKEQ